MRNVILKQTRSDGVTFHRIITLALIAAAAFLYRYPNLLPPFASYHPWGRIISQRADHYGNFKMAGAINGLRNELSGFEVQNHTLNLYY